MEKYDILEYIFLNKNFDIFDLYARFVQENGSGVFEDYHTFCAYCRELGENKEIVAFDKLLANHIVNKTDRFKKQVNVERVFNKRFYDYVLSKADKGERIWDIACGAHPFSLIYLQEKGVDITGIDPLIDTSFMGYFKAKYHKGYIQKMEDVFMEENPSMLIGLRPCEAQEPMLDLAQKYGKRVISKPCECRIVDESGESIVGEDKKLDYYVKKYSFLHKGKLSGIEIKNLPNHANDVMETR